MYCLLSFLLIGKLRYNFKNNEKIYCPPFAFPYICYNEEIYATVRTLILDCCNFSFTCVTASASGKPANRISLDPKCK